MKHANRLLKIFLVMVMLVLQIFTPLTVSTNEIMPQSSDVMPFDDEALADISFDDETLADIPLEDDLLEDEGLADIPFEDELLEDELPGYIELDKNLDDGCLVMPVDTSLADGDIPELLFADQYLEYIAVPDECMTPEPFNGRTAPMGGALSGISISLVTSSLVTSAFNVRTAPMGGVASGVVQFVLEPVGDLPAGVTREDLMNVGTVTHRLFADGTTNEVATAVNGRYGRDAIFLGQSANGNRFRVMIAGFEGYVNREGEEYTVWVRAHAIRVRANAVFIPFADYPKNTSGTNVRSMSHYVNENGELWRMLTGNVHNNVIAGRILTGPAPGWMTPDTRYYSYDGVFFYRDPRHIRVNGSGAVNADNPFFNYFQYLSFRSISTITAAQLNTALINANVRDINTSVMINQGNAFIAAQNRYGINALLMFAKAMHESAAGTSAIARHNNNIFGLGAFDAAPGANAWRFDSVRDSIDDLANGWLSRGYLWPLDWRYAGPHVGHKGSGMNVRYATDPYWGQKIAGWAFRIDRTRPENNRDMNREQIAIRQNTATVDVQNAAGTTLYTANPRQMRFFPFLITGTGTNNRLRVLTDPPIVNGVINRTALFNHTTAIGYIPNSYVWWTGASSPSTPPGTPPPQQTTPVASPNNMRRTGRTIRRAHFRTGPGTDHSTIHVITNYTDVIITGASNDWRHVRIGNDQGWIHRSHLRETVELGRTHRTAHFRRGAGTNHATIRVLPPNTQITIVGWTLPGNPGNWLRVRIGSEYGWVHSSHVNMNRNVTADTHATGHLRQGPDVTTTSIRVLQPNTRVTILGHSGDGRWVRLRAGNDTGWVYAGHVGERGRTTSSVNLRSGAGTNHRIIRTLPNNTNVRVLRRSVGGRWIHVRVGNDTGWISAEFFRN